MIEERPDDGEGWFLVVVESRELLLCMYLKKCLFFNERLNNRPIGNSTYIPVKYEKNIRYCEYIYII